MDRYRRRRATSRSSLLIAAAVFLLPGGGQAASTFEGDAAGRLRRRLRLSRPAHVPRIPRRRCTASATATARLLYGSLALVAFARRSAQKRMWQTSLGELVWFALLRWRGVRADGRVPPLAQLLTRRRPGGGAPRILGWMATKTAERASGEARTSLAEQRRALPDQPGVYLFRDGKGRVIYVGKAKSVRKRVASHFSKAQVPSSPGHAEMVASVESVECVVVATEAEALLAEQSFIKQYRPRFNIRLRDDKSYPFIAISLDEDYPRVYFTRERHRPGRAYFGPYSNAKRVRGTLEVLAKVFMFRSCTGPEPGRRSGSPCLDYYIKRCEAPCVGLRLQGGLPREHRRRRSTSSRDASRTIERELEQRMRAAAAAEEFEQATRRAQPPARRALAAGAPARGQRVGRHVRRGRGGRRRARGQRAGVPGARRRAVGPPVLLPRPTRPSAASPRSRRSSCCSTTPGTCRSRRCSSCSASSTSARRSTDALASRRGGPVELRAAERGEKRGSSSSPSATRAWRSTRSG